MKALDFTGKVFGRLTAVERDGSQLHSGGRQTALWKCVCVCGKTTSVGVQNLKKGITKSCGCLRVELSRERSKTHGLSGHRVWVIWSGMISRCDNPKNLGYRDYGGRGITVCAEWYKFENFVRDMGVPPVGFSIDREDNDLGYFKENCRWISPFDQGSNKRNNRWITVNGDSKTLSQWGRKTRLGANLIWARLKRGWTEQDAVLKPKMKIFR